MSEEKIMNLENEDLDIDFKNLFNLLRSPLDVKPPFIWGCEASAISSKN